MPEFNIAPDQIKPTIRVTPPDLRGLFNRNARDTGAGTNCVSIGTVVSFNSTNQTAEIQLKFLRRVGNDLLSYPNLINCPVVFLNGGDGALTFPIENGDTCLVFFNDRNLDNWWLNGNTLEPNSSRVHDLNDAIALVGIRSLANSLQNYTTTGVKLKHGNAEVILEDDTVAALNCKTGAENTVAVGDKIRIQVGNLNTLRVALDALFTALVNWIDTGGDVPSAGTITAINAAKTLVDSILE